MLRLDSLPEKTLKILECLAVDEQSRNFTLIGGTALALQIGHRKSEDLDFWLPAEKMDKETISAAVRRAQQAGSAADPACSSEYAKSVLLGDVPLDQEDEGFDSVDVTEKLEDIYAFFKCAINEHEQALAEETFDVMLCNLCREVRCVCDAKSLG